jgi:predicted MFS family arabinose efflux permease
MLQIPPHQPRQTKLSLWQQLTSGFRYAAGTPALRALILLALVFSVFGVSYTTVLPAFVDKVLQQGAQAFGALNAFLGVGAVTGALLVARYGDRGLRGRWLSWAILGFPWVLTVFALNRSYPVALGLGIVLGIGFMSTFTLINTLVQSNLLDEMRGRVLSIYTLTFFGFMPFGNLALGMISEWWGISQAIILSAAVSFVLALWILWKTPAVRQLP